jgi:CRISPR-associated endonuclease/helicase Cas3
VPRSRRDKVAVVTGIDLLPGDFPAFFKAVYGFGPFPWQARLLNHLAKRGCWPAVLDLPTGSGKTAAIDIALFHLALEAERAADRRAPLRIALVVDRRLIVDDAFARAKKLAETLRHSTEPVVRKVSLALRRLAGSDQPPLLVRRLRGGAPREDDWARTPVQPTILCSTVDQVGSRLLFRGYGVSDRMKPIHAGLLGSDCLILLDEAHLAKPFRQTLESIAALRGKDRSPWQFALLSATPGARAEGPGTEREEPFGLDADDRADPELAKRLAVSKMATLDEIAGKQGVAAEAHRVEMIAERTKETLETLKRQVPNPAIGVVLNRVARARKVFERLRSELPDTETVLIIGPARPIEREAQAAHELQPIRTGRPRDLEKPLIIVATQTIEAGVDIDFDGLVSEAAPLDALRQRFGRLNRAGREDIAPVAAVLAHRDDIGSRADDPVYGDRIKKTWEALRGVAAESAARTVDFGIGGFPPKLLEQTDELAAEKADAPVLMPAYADLWSQTSPIPNADPDVSLFLHGPDRSPASVLIVWRADIAEDDLDNRNRARLIELLGLVPPRSGEAVEVPLWTARAWLLRQNEPLANLSDAAERPPDGVENNWGGPARLSLCGIRIRSDGRCHSRRIAPGRSDRRRCYLRGLRRMGLGPGFQGACTRSG